MSAMLPAMSMATSGGGQVPLAVTHILYLSDKPGKNPFSGAENHVLTLVTWLAESGVDVELLVLLWNDGARVQRRLDELREKGVKIEIIARAAGDPNSRQLRRALGTWLRLTRALRERSDRIVHLHLDLIALPVAARLAGCKHVVVSIHNDEQYYRRRRWHGWLRLVDRWVERYIAITRHVKSHYCEQAGVASSRCEVIYYGVPQPLAAKNARAELKLDQDAFVVGFIGRLTAQKDVGTLLRAIALVPKAVCVLIGDGEERASLQQLATELEIDSRVVFAGALPDAAQLMPAFDVFCLPSRWEGLGLVLVEAMLQDVPIVGSHAGAIPEVLADGKCGYLCPVGDAKAFSLAIEQIRADPQQARALAAHARAYACANFVVERMGQQTQKLYRGLLEQACHT